MKYSFGLLKPDCIKRDLVKEVFAMIKAVGLKIIASKRVMLTEDQVAGVWPTCVGEPFYGEMVEFSLSDDSIVFITEGDDAIDRLSDLVGYHDPVIAKKGTIRERFATSLTENIIHSTMDEKTFWKETALFFEVSFN